MIKFIAQSGFLKNVSRLKYLFTSKHIFLKKFRNEEILQMCVELLKCVDPDD